MGIDLSAPRRAVQEKLMTGTCRIYDDPGGTHTWVLDEETLQLTPDISDDKLVYQGKIWTKPSGRQPGQAEMGGFPAAEGEYVQAIPWTAPALKPGLLVVLLADVDPSLKGLSTRITSVERGSIHIWRKFTARYVETSRG